MANVSLHLGWALLLLKPLESSVLGPQSSVEPQKPSLRLGVSPIAVPVGT